MITVVKTLANIAEFVHVPRFDRSYHPCVVHRANVDIVKALGYKLTKRMSLPAWLDFAVITVAVSVWIQD